MSNKRTILSRPRTKVYDANYSIGESMYRPALDRLNRKYSGRPLTPPPRQPPTMSEDLIGRHERAFCDDDINACRRRAEKHITGETMFDSRSARLDARDLLDNFDEETVSRIKSIRASKKVSVIDDVGMESAVNNINTQRFIDRTDKILDTVGIVRDSTRKALQDHGTTEDISFKRRSLRLSSNDDAGNAEVMKWSALKDDKLEKVESGAVLRAKQSRARLTDLDDEMEAIAERQATRERKAARLRALIAEVAEDNGIPAPISSSSTSSSTRKMVRIRDQEETSY